MVFDFIPTIFQNASDKDVEKIEHFDKSYPYYSYIPINDNTTSKKIKTIQEDINTLTEQAKSIENKLSKLEKEVSATKELYAIYKENDVNISYNETKLLIKEKKSELQYNLSNTYKQIKKLEEDKKSLSIEYFFERFINKSEENDELNQMYQPTLLPSHAPIIDSSSELPIADGPFPIKPIDTKFYSPYTVENIEKIKKDIKRIEEYIKKTQEIKEEDEVEIIEEEKECQAFEVFSDNKNQESTEIEAYNSDEEEYASFN